MSDALQNLVGQQNARYGIIKIFNALQEASANKHLLYVRLLTHIQAEQMWCNHTSFYCRLCILCLCINLSRLKCKYRSSVNDNAWTGSRHGRQIKISFQCVRVACIQKRKVDSENRMFKDASLGNVLCQPFDPSFPLFSLSFSLLVSPHSGPHGDGAEGDVS